MKIFIPLISFIILVTNVFGQQFIVKKGKELDSKYHTGVLVKTEKDNFISIAWDVESKVSLQRYDSDLNMIPGRIEDRITRYEVRQPFCLGDKVALLAYAYNNIAIYFTDEQLVNPLTKLDLFKISGRGADISYGYSTDSSYYYIVSRSEDGRNSPVLFEGVVLDRKLNIVSRINLASSDARKEVGGANYIVNTQGQFYIFYGSSNRNELLVQEPSGKSDRIVLSGMPTGISDHCTLIEKNNKIYFCSILVGNSDKVSTGIQSGVIDLSSKSVQMTTDPTARRSVIPGTYEIMEQTPKAQLSYPDGSWIFVFEQDETQRHQSYYGGTNIPSYSSSSFLRRDVYVVRLSPEWKVEWFRRITKRQGEAGLHNYIGIACMPDKNGGLHIILNDDRSNATIETEKPEFYNYSTIGRRTLSCIDISRDGKTSKQFISDNVDNGFVFSPDRAVYIGSNKILYMATDWIRLSLKCRFRPEIIVLQE